jgi:hypothetical protein
MRRKMWGSLGIKTLHPITSPQLGRQQHKVTIQSSIMWMRLNMHTTPAEVGRMLTLPVITTVKAWSSAA